MFDWILEAFRLLIYFISIWIYKLITWLYNIFMRLCNSRILDSEILELMASRIGVILGIIMLFIVIFSMLQMVLEPDKMSDKEKGFGNIIKKVLIVIVMLGMSSSAFSLMYGVQKTIIKSNIIAKFILPYEVDTDRFGGLLSAELFTAFYNFDKNLAADGYQSDEKMCEDSISTLKGEIIENNEFDEGWKCINSKSGDAYIIDFNILLLPIVGAAAVYFIFSYCLSIGMRTFQLVFLEVISPMAIVSYLSPKKETMFNKWWKIYFSTYIDVFLRVALINIVVFLIGVIFDANLSGTFWESVGGKDGTMTDTLITVFIIMSLLMFAKKAPDLIKELFPGPASKLGFGVTPPKKLLDSMAGADLIKRGYGAVSAGTSAWSQNVRKALGNAITETDENKKGKAWGRVVGSALFGGVGGITRGIMTTDASGRKRAAANAYAARQARYKMRDLGYGAGIADLIKFKKDPTTGQISYDVSGWRALGNQGKDMLRGLGMQDQYIEDLADMKDLSIETQQRQLAKMQEDYLQKIRAKKDADPTAQSYIISASKSKDKMFIVQDEKGNIQIVDKDTAKTIDPDAFAIGEMKAAIGKATGDSKKLHQKAEEQKQKANGGKK